MNGKTCGGKGFPECDDTLVRNEDDDDNKDDCNMIDMFLAALAALYPPWILTD